MQDYSNYSFGQNDDRREGGDDMGSSNDSDEAQLREILSDDFMMLSEQDQQRWGSERPQHHPHKRKDPHHKHFSGEGVPQYYGEVRAPFEHRPTLPFGHPHAHPHEARVHAPLPDVHDGAQSGDPLRGGAPLMGYPPHEGSYLRGAGYGPPYGYTPFGHFGGGGGGSAGGALGPLGGGEVFTPGYGGSYLGTGKPPRGAAASRGAVQLSEHARGGESKIGAGGRRLHGRAAMGRANGGAPVRPTSAGALAGVQGHGAELQGAPKGSSSSLARAMRGSGVASGLASSASDPSGQMRSLPSREQLREAAAAEVKNAQAQQAEAMKRYSSELGLEPFSALPGRHDESGAEENDDEDGGSEAEGGGGKKRKASGSGARSKEDKEKANRLRNREHAKNTRLRKKAYVAKLSALVSDLSTQRAAAGQSRSAAEAARRERNAVRQGAVRQFLALHAAGEVELQRWRAVADERVVCTMPITPFRSFGAGEAVHSSRVLRGLDAVVRDARSLALCVEAIGAPAPAWKEARARGERIVASYDLDTIDMLLTGDEGMARWVFATRNGVACGAAGECRLHGMLRCSFTPENRLASVEFMFDVMTFMQQMHRASGGEATKASVVVPNTFKMATAPSDEARVVTAAQHPFPVVFVNGAWSRLCGYTEEESTGRTCGELLQGPDTDKAEIARVMADVKQGLPAAVTVTNYTKTGRPFHNFLRIFPLAGGEKSSEMSHCLAVLEEIPFPPEAGGLEPQPPDRLVGLTSPSCF